MRMRFRVENQGESKAYQSEFACMRNFASRMRMTVWVRDVEVMDTKFRVMASGLNLEKPL